MQVVNLSARYGRLPEPDPKIGNIRAKVPNCIPSRRYLLITNEEVKEYFVNLIEARFILKHYSDKYRVVTDDDLQIEVTLHPKRIKGGKKASVVEVTDDHFVVEYRDTKYKVPFSSATHTEGAAYGQESMAVS